MRVVIIVRTATGIVMYCPTAAGVLSKRCHGVHAWRSSGAGTAGDVHVQFHRLGSSGIPQSGDVTVKTES